MKLNKEEFSASEMGQALKYILNEADTALSDMICSDYLSEGYKAAKETVAIAMGKWEICQMMFSQIYGIDYHFSRTDEYYGVCTEDESDWLFKVER